MWRCPRVDGCWRSHCCLHCRLQQKSVDCNSNQCLPCLPCSPCTTACMTLAEHWTGLLNMPRPSSYMNALVQGAACFSWVERLVHMAQLSL